MGQDKPTVLSTDAESTPDQDSSSAGTGFDEFRLNKLLGKFLCETKRETQEESTGTPGQRSRVLSSPLPGFTALSSGGSVVSVRSHIKEAGREKQA